MSKNYAIIENDVVVNIAVSEFPLKNNWIESSAQIGWKYIDGIFIQPEYIPPPVIRTRLEIINLLGSDYVSIIAASKTDIEVEVWLEKFRLTESFDMSDSTVQSDIQLLVTKNLISQQKANNILGL